MFGTQPHRIHGYGARGLVDICRQVQAPVRRFAAQLRMAACLPSEQTTTMGPAASRAPNRGQRRKDCAPRALRGGLRRQACHLYSYAGVEPWNPEHSQGGD